ncbi:hypothetical protein MMC10_010165 [Thelotrema lepadinum]|nr:hypothetical protein [Thelotrema lepadinum]
MTGFEEIPTTIPAAFSPEMWEQLLGPHLQLDKLSERCPDMFINPGLDSEGVLEGLDWHRDEVKILIECMGPDHPELSRWIMEQILKNETWKFDQVAALREFLKQVKTWYNPLHREVHKASLEIDMFNEEEVEAVLELLNDISSILPKLSTLKICFLTFRLGPGCKSLYADQRKFKPDDQDHGAFSKDFLRVTDALAKIHVDDASIEGLQDSEVEKDIRAAMTITTNHGW